MIKDENNVEFGLIFSCPAEQTMNSNIKLVAEILDIKQDLSFHSARHTFATQFLKKSKFANGILILQKLLGHSSISSTMIYSHIIDTDIDNSLSSFDD